MHVFVSAYAGLSSSTLSLFQRVHKQLQIALEHRYAHAHQQQHDITSIMLPVAFLTTKPNSVPVKMLPHLPLLVLLELEIFMRHHHRDDYHDYHNHHHPNQSSTATPSRSKMTSHACKCFLLPFVP
jgi:ABC-type nickel/cobalt efflux system permease component RcnA